MADRVRRPQQFEEMMAELCKEKGLFKTYKDLMIFAACLGFKRRKRVEFNKSSEPINLQIFSGSFDHTVINTIAIAETNDPTVMSSEQDKSDQRIKVFEEYACGGLEILQDEIWDSKLMSWEDAFLRFVLQEETESSLLDDITSLATS